MGELFDAVWAAIVCLAEFMFLWAVMFYVAPGLATAILVLVLTVGLFFGIIGGIIGVITS